MKRHRPGFTLIELLVVMGIIIILASLTIGIQRYVYSVQSTAKAKADLQAISTALETFKMRYGDYPWLGSANTATASGDLSTDTSSDLYRVLKGELIIMYKDGEDGAPGSYGMHPPATIKPLLDVRNLSVGEKGSIKFVADPWGNPYKYSYKTKAKDTNWQGVGFTIISMGPNGAVTPAIFNRVKVGDMPTQTEYRAETEAQLKDIEDVSTEWPSHDDVVPNMQ